MKRGAPRGRDLVGRLVRTKDPLLAVFVVGHEPGEAPCHARVTRERAVLGARQLQAHPRLAQQEYERAGAQQYKMMRSVTLCLAAPPWVGAHFIATE